MLGDQARGTARPRPSPKPRLGRRDAGAASLPAPGRPASPSSPGRGRGRTEPSEGCSSPAPPRCPTCLSGGPGRRQARTSARPRGAEHGCERPGRGAGDPHRALPQPPGRARRAERATAQPPGSARGRTGGRGPAAARAGPRPGTCPSAREERREEARGGERREAAPPLPRGATPSPAGPPESASMALRAQLSSGQSTKA